jgi:hypothetical protein
MIIELQQHSFYELIINKARGKSGPVMFNFTNFILSFCVSFISLLVILPMFHLPAKSQSFRGEKRKD